MIEEPWRLPLCDLLLVTIQIYSEDEAEEFEEEVKAQEKAEKKEEQERVDTSVYGKIGKKKATAEIKKLTPLFAKSQSDDKKTRDQALKDAKEINEWAKKHNLAIVQQSYYKLFERKLAWICLGVSLTASTSLALSSP